MNKYRESRKRVINCINSILVVILKLNLAFGKSLGNDFSGFFLNYTSVKIF